MSAKHTPGPWFVGKEFSHPYRYWIVTDETTWVDRICCVPDYHGAPNDANARLIAASPELLAALIETLAIAARNEEGEFADRARAAISKATAA